jgi:hypothetical protein
MPAKSKVIVRIKPVKSTNKKTWTDKVDDPLKVHKVEKLGKRFSDMNVGDKMFIATPKIIAGYIESIPKGRSIPLITLRKDLATEFGADNTCPLTTGIFLRIAAEAALEQLHDGKNISRITPFWRVVDEKMPVAKKLSCGVGFIKAQRKKEGLDKT